MPNGFREYLLKQGNVKPNHIPYLIKWVGNFYSFLKIADTGFITAENKNQYLSHISKTHEDWQDIGNQGAVLKNPFSSSFVSTFFSLPNQNR